ncbi:hypothetical protein [Mesorhizobium silamurunense]|uniref:hypothetical protein n=1 Tax=Mesorhizobium silamurunense TaxID=499528 RepID=UPI00177E5E44|nr:hypothetical protein [Mesorhizobium silamurunense]
MTDDARPKWKHKISEADVRWLASGVIKITHHWEMTGADTSRNWIELHKEKEKRSFDSSFLNDNDYFQFKPNWRELVVPTYYGERAIQDLAAIDAWEKKNQHDRAELERLKRKFGEIA